MGPANFVFFSKEWTEVGTLAKTTGIDLGILAGTKNLESTGVQCSGLPTGIQQGLKTSHTV